MTDNGFVPGTVHLVDIEGTLRAKHASGGQNDVVLIPAPSDDPDDPLNWSAKRKWLSTASISVNHCESKAIMIWVPYTNTNGQWIASKLLQGFFGAPVESLCEISYFTHERGTYIAVYAFSLVGSSFLAPLFAGFINEGQGWRWVLYWCAILSGLTFVFLFFFMEETNYHRKALVGNEMKKIEDCSPGTRESYAGDDAIEKGNLDAELKVSTIADEEGRVDDVPSVKSYYHKLKIFDKQELRYPNQLKDMILRPLIFLSFPVIFYAGFSYGSNLVWFNVLNGTASLILSGKPSLYTGGVGDWLILKLARRNGGIMQSEYRLWLFSLSILLVPGGLILWGVGAAHNVQWFGLVFAMGVIGFTNTVGVQLSVSYCIDSYRELSGEAMVTVILVRNTMSFAIGYGITPWVTQMGLQNAFIVAAFAGLAQVLTVFFFIRYGQNMRRASVVTANILSPRNHAKASP
ncbi:MAG: hypothetical protein ASARMPRED_002697 [Alectoria sarmentosa]|nr:MAG: hypothetical protein ASARMPRED_002697 [Alectoria sarmentosa]